MHDIAHLLRPGHLQQLSNILKDPEASQNDRYGVYIVVCVGWEASSLREGWKLRVLLRMGVVVGE